MKHGTVGGYTNNRCRCEDCTLAMRTYQREWRRKNPERVKVAQDRHNRKHPERFERYRKRNRDRIRSMERQRLYGISEQEYQKLRAEQEERCAICRRDGDLHVDHDHETGAVRGLLCPRCNMALGLLEDDEGRLRDAADYLTAQYKVRLA